VDPELQCKGIGSKMMKPILDQADQDGLPCYLDTPSERSLPYALSRSILSFRYLQKTRFFKRLGFEVVFDVSNPSSVLSILFYFEFRFRTNLFTDLFFSLSFLLFILSSM
jgi:hypothetical protein